jgi:tRNA dimethylallyltransferase
MQQLIVIEGPTASGKTALSVALAQQLNTVVLSADSRQFYKELAIGTAKPTADEMGTVPHYFIDSHSIHEPVTSGMFEKEALHLLKNELAHLPYIVIAGGSGMFIDALCVGLDPIPTDENLALQLRKELDNNGIEGLLTELKECDPEYYERVDKENPSRVLRALEVIRLTGKPFSEWRKNKPAPRPFTVKRFLIEHSREQLYARINKRVDLMVEAGLLDEAKAVNAFRELTTLQTVGYKECFDYFDGKTDLATCIEKIKQHTRNYAKRQLTWFRRHPETIRLPYSDNLSMVKTILQALDN